MILQEPKVEFVALNLSESIVTSSGGGQRCVGTQPESKDCEDWDTSIPYSGS